MGVLNETQHERDIELSEITGLAIDVLENVDFYSPEALQRYNGEVDLEDRLILYTESYRKTIPYFRTLMHTSVHKRDKQLIELLKSTRGKICLEFGSGVGTHSIALLENNNLVHLLDVADSPYQKFTKQRLEHRGIDKSKYLHFNHYAHLTTNYYDVIVCTDVLEHVVEPVQDLHRMTCSLKKGGMLHLRVSKRICNTEGHFEDTILKWKAGGEEYLKKNYKLIKPTIYKKL